MDQTKVGHRRDRFVETAILARIEVGRDHARASPRVTLYADPRVSRPGSTSVSSTTRSSFLGSACSTGQWDLRSGIDAYLGGLDYRDLSVLEVGTANGFVCFELERRGARVVSVDLPALATYDTRPAANVHDIETMRLGVERIRNAYWLAHSLFSASARVVYSHVNDLPEELGRFDVVVLANVLQHCRTHGCRDQRQPFADRVVITESDWIHAERDDVARMTLFGGPSPFSWFQVTPFLLTTLLSELSYDDQDVSRHEQRLMEDVDYEEGRGKPRRWDGRLVPHFTVVARRRTSG